ncbi:hypothetical protein CP973_07325 [Streptomyces albofaciens JCM 4342]|nr:hypothetical protein CP973_07325 [Streptomyces albofaciens JCM 4342]
MSASLLAALLTTLSAACGRQHPPPVHPPPTRRWRITARPLPEPGRVSAYALSFLSRVARSPDWQSR